MKKDSDTDRPRHWSKLLTGHLPLETETSVFILVNCLDFFMTYWMLWHNQFGTGTYYESNPIAQYFLHRWGVVKGLLGFKLGIVVFVCVLSQIIALRKPETARKLLIVGTLIVMGVVIYSAALYLRHSGPIQL
jgi:hypothetical protein